jgi:hypothetical protein
MSEGNRHFAKFIPTGEEVVVIGYRQKTNDVLVTFPSAMAQQESQDLRRIVMSKEAQSKDFLMDVVGGSVLQSAHHPSGTDWQTYLIRQAAMGRSQSVRKLTVKDLEFYDDSQKAYFGGYGESIEPEVDAVRKTRIQAQDAAMSGRPLPEPIVATAAPVAPVEPAAASEMVSALTAIAQGQAAILEALANMNKPAKKAPRRKAPTKRKVATKKVTAPTTESSDTTEVV